MKNIVSILFILPFITLFSCSSVKSEFVIIEVAENEAIITEYIGNSSLVRIHLVSPLDLTKFKASFSYF